MTIKEAMNLDVKALTKELEEAKKEEKTKYRKVSNRYKGDMPMDVFSKEIMPISNRIKELEKKIDIALIANCKVGDGATEILWSDRHAMTIIARPSPATIICQRDKAIRIDKNGMSECQDYKYKRDKKGATLTARWSRAQNCWKCKRTYIGVGYRREYYDYSF